MVLRLTGCDLKLIGKHPDKLTLFSQIGGSAELLNKFSEEKRVFDIVIEASGHPSGWDLALENVKPRGTIVLKSTYHGSINFNPAPLVIDEINVLGSRCGRFEPALRLMQNGFIDPTPLISGIFPMDSIEQAFDKSMEKSALKILIKMT